MAAAGTWGEALAYPLGCVGAIVGVVVGALVTNLAAKSNIYALIAVGPLAGYGARLLANLGARRTDLFLGIMAAVISLAGGIWTEWWVWPFLADNTLPYFVQHLAEVKPIDLLVIGVGAAIAFFLAWRK